MIKRVDDIFTTTTQGADALLEKMRSLKEGWQNSNARLTALLIQCDAISRRIEMKTATSNDIQEGRKLAQEMTEELAKVKGRGVIPNEIQSEVGKYDNTYHVATGSEITPDIVIEPVERYTSRPSSELTQKERIQRAVFNLQSHIKSMGEQRPEVWRKIDRALLHRSTLINNEPEWKEHWPPFCFLPVNVYTSFNPLDLDKPNILYPATVSLAAWRQTQSAYMFDSEIEQEIWETPLKGEIPVSVLQHAPVQAPLIVLPPHAFEIVGGADAVIVQLTMVGQFPALLFMLIDGLETACFTIPVRKTLQQSLDWIIHVVESNGQEVSENGVTFTAHGYNASKTITVGGEPTGDNYVLKVLRECQADIAGVISMFLYLCSDEPDIDKILPKPTPVKTKKTGIRIFPASAPTYVHVGVRLGAAIKKFKERAAQQEQLEAREPGHHAGPRPHVRKAHWHLYWTGPRIAERIPRVHWLSATPINAKYGELETVVHPVEK